MKYFFFLPVAVALLALGWVMDLSPLPKQQGLWANITVFLLLTGAALGAWGGMVLWLAHRNLPEDHHRRWLRRQSSLVLIGEIFLLFSLATRTGSASVTVVPALLSGCGFFLVLAAWLCGIQLRRTLRKSPIG